MSGGRKTSEAVYAALPATRVEIAQRTGLDRSQIDGVLTRGLRFGKLTRDGGYASTYRLASEQEAA